MLIVAPSSRIKRFAKIATGPTVNGSTPTPPKPSGYQFSLRTLLGVITLLSLLAAALGGIIRSGADPQRNPRVMLYVVLALCSPLLALVAASLYRTLRRSRTRK